MDLRDFEPFYSKCHENMEALNGANVGFYGMGGVGTIVLILKVTWQILEEKLYVHMIGVYGMGGVGKTTLVKKLSVWVFHDKVCVTSAPNHRGISSTCQVKKLDLKAVGIPFGDVDNELPFGKIVKMR